MKGPGKKYDNVIIGDVGGTKIRLELVRLFHDDINKRISLKNLEMLESQKYPSFLACLEEYLSDVPEQNKPKIGVVGMAGPVINNVIQTTVNIKHWGSTDGNMIAEKTAMTSFIFINDFTAAGYGVSRLLPIHYTTLGKSGEAPLKEGENSVKVVIGPGTGMG